MKPQNKKLVLLIASWRSACGFVIYRTPDPPPQGELEGVWEFLMYANAPNLFQRAAYMNSSKFLTDH